MSPTSAGETANSSEYGPSTEKGNDRQSRGNDDVAMDMAYIDHINEFTRNPYEVMQKYIYNNMHHTWAGKFFMKFVARHKYHYNRIAAIFGKHMQPEKFFICVMGFAAVLYMLLIGLVPFYIRFVFAAIAFYHNSYGDAFVWVAAGTIGALCTGFGKRSDSPKAILNSFAGLTFAMIGPTLLAFNVIEWSFALLLLAAGLIYMTTHIGKAITRHSMSQSTNIFWALIGAAISLIIVYCYMHYGAIRSGYYCNQFRGTSHHHRCISKYDVYVGKELDHMFHDDVGPAPRAKSAWTDYIPSGPSLAVKQGETAARSVLAYMGIIFALSPLALIQVITYFGPLDRSTSTNSAILTTKDSKDKEAVNKTSVFTTLFSVFLSKEISIYMSLAILSFFESMLVGFIMLTAGVLAVGAGYIAYALTAKPLFQQAGADTAFINLRLIGKDGSLIAGIDARQPIGHNIKMTIVFCGALSLAISVACWTNIWLGIMTAPTVFLASHVFDYTNKNGTRLITLTSLIVTSLSMTNVCTIVMAISAGFLLHQGGTMIRVNTKSNNVVRETDIKSVASITSPLPDC